MTAWFVPNAHILLRSRLTFVIGVFVKVRSGLRWLYGAGTEVTRIILALRLVPQSMSSTKRSESSSGAAKNGGGGKRQKTGKCLWGWAGVVWTKSSNLPFVREGHSDSTELLDMAATSLSILAQTAGISLSGIAVCQPAQFPYCLPPVAAKTSNGPKTEEKTTAGVSMRGPV